MARSNGISGAGVGIATAGALLMYAGIRDVPVLTALREVTTGNLPKGNKDKQGQPGAASTAAQAALDTSSAGGVAGGTGGGVVDASLSTGALPQLANAALKYQGVPYAWGGTNPATGLDCSGLVYVSFKDVGVNAPRTTYTQQPWKALKSVSAASASAGDLVFWPGHVAIYLGSGMVVHAPHPGAVVRTEQVTQAGPRGTSATYKRYTGTVAKPKGKSPSKSPKTREV